MNIGEARWSGCERLLFRKNHWNRPWKSAMSSEIFIGNMICVFVIAMDWIMQCVELRYAPIRGTLCTFKIIIDNRNIIKPDMETIVESSIDCCAECGRSPKCSTINFRNYDRMCQLSNKKGTCMESDEARTVRGYRMYQKQVDFFHQISSSPSDGTRSSHESVCPKTSVRTILVGSSKFIGLSHNLE
jgi:hypothetical protein